MIGRMCDSLRLTIFTILHVTQGLQPRLQEHMLESIDVIDLAGPNLAICHCTNETITYTSVMSSPNS